MKLEVIDLRKSYGKMEALKGVDVHLTEGVYGFLGPNGAGKSTFMNILTGNLKASSGEILYNGRNIFELGRRFREKIGYMPQQQSLYPNFTAVGFLSYMAALRGMNKEKTKKRIPEVLHQVGLANVAFNKLSSFSGGMKQRILIAQAVLANPEILILDEPTAGLDPKQRIAIRNLISEISEDKIVIIATHVVSDVELIANRILLIRNGEMIADSTRDELIRQLKDKVWELELSKDEYPSLLEDSSILIGNVSREGSRLYVRAIIENELSRWGGKRVRPGLEDVYLYYFKE